MTENQIRAQWGSIVAIFKSTKTALNEYGVRYKEDGKTPTGKKYSCNCPGFRFRKECKHVREAEARGLTSWKESPMADPAVLAIQTAIREAGFNEWELFRTYGGPEAAMAKLAESLRKHFKGIGEKHATTERVLRPIILPD